MGCIARSTHLVAFISDAVSPTPGTWTLESAKRANREAPRSKALVLEADLPLLGHPAGRCSEGYFGPPKISRRQAFLALCVRVCALEGGVEEGVSFCV